MSLQHSTSGRSSLQEEIIQLSTFDQDQIQNLTVKINELPIEEQGTTWLALGEALYKLEKDEQAMSYIEKSIQLNDQIGRAFFYKGLIASMILGRQDECIPAFEKAIELNPNIGYYWLELSRAYGRMQLSDKAFQSLKKYVEIDRQDAIKRDVVSSFYNLGMKLFLEKSWENSLESFLIADELCEGDIDLQLKGKIIQTLEKLGKSTERDEEIANLYKLYKNKKLGNQTRFCRDQFTLDSYQNKSNVSVFVYEFFELIGDMAVKYLFQVTDEKSILCKISLGSYTLTNQVHMELNSASQPDDRLYHLDGYYPGMHTTLGFYSGTTERPNISYEELKSKVLDVLQGTDLKVLSSSDTSQ